MADLRDEGFDDENLLIILNINQAGRHLALDVHDFTVRFYTIDSAGVWSSFDAVYDHDDLINNTASTLGLTPEGQGTGSAGYAFRITFEGDEGTNFFSDDRNRVGTLVEESMAIDNESNDGPENFYVGDADVNTVVPEPASLVLLTIGAGVAVFSRKPVRR